MIDEKMVDEYADNYDIMNKDLSPKSPRHIVKECFLAGLKIGRQQQSGVGWIDTAHIEINLHDAVENIKKQLDAMLQEILGGNDKEVEE